MMMTDDGFRIITKRKNNIDKLFELMKSNNFQEKFGTMSITKDKHQRGETIFVPGVDGYINMVQLGSDPKFIEIAQIEEAIFEERFSVSVAGVAGTAASIAGGIFNKVTDAMGPEIGTVKGLLGGAINAVGTVGRIAKYASEKKERDAIKKKRDALEGNWGVLDALAKDIEKLVEVKKGGCYIATSIYGSYNCPEVWTLRRYRDSTLSASWYGKQFIRIYYTISPKIVELFGNKKWFNRFWKPVLNRFIRKLQNSGIESSPYSDGSE